jgi:hypothetical protein
METNDTLRPLRVLIELTLLCCLISICFHKVVDLLKEIDVFVIASLAVVMCGMAL